MSIKANKGVVVL